MPANRPPDRYQPAHLETFPAKPYYPFFTAHMAQGQFLKGPLVLTFLQRDGNLLVCDRPPWHPDGGKRALHLLGGSFAGHLFVTADQHVFVADTAHAICSGFLLSEIDSDRARQQ